MKGQNNKIELDHLQRQGINLSRDSTDSQRIVSDALSGFARERQSPHSIEQPIKQIRKLFPVKSLCRGAAVIAAGVVIVNDGQCPQAAAG